MITLCLLCKHRSLHTAFALLVAPFPVVAASLYIDGYNSLTKVTHNPAETSNHGNVTISAAFIVLCLMSIINFTTAEIGALLLVPMCLMVRPVKPDLRSRRVKILLRALCNMVLVTIAFSSIFITNQPTKRTLKKTKDGQTLLPLHFRGHDSDVTSSIPSSDHKTRTHQTILHHSRHRNHRKNSTKPLLDLGTNLTWLNCHQLQSLTSLHTVACDSDSCEVTPGNGCNENSCLYKQPNPLGSQNITSRVVQDAASFSTTDGGNFLSQVSLRIFTFSCAYNLQGVSPPVDGVLSLSPGSSSFTKQVTSDFNVIPKLALCLPSYGTGRFYVAGVYLKLHQTQRL
uniref:Xylanase inhibitor N-terminal domain-containing protein n=2 Tax=Brassica oleracea TaxID=3712 RepID=A0A0D3AJU2_BRAOL|nr:unnamed protein product [Brassica oleracea]